MAVIQLRDRAHISARGIIPKERSRDFTDAEYSVGQIHHASGSISLDQTEVLFVNADCV